ncbi:flagellin [Tianweitania sediminis]|uniref:Flagellin n=1 Tax=Tianweitania sediminis TaxID=1502156 RepID=A0A8J7ULR7_9HYPH|nr:flagellin [Tianweitania sediminis]MBP0441240.1 flagellin [Tianweitania sediminis]
MSSIMTNVSAMTALKSLNATNAALQTTQARISTGFRVAEASDNAAYWSIATTMRSDNKALATVQDALGLGAAKVDTAYTGMNAAKDIVDEIKAKLVAAREGGVDKAKVQAEIKTLQGQLTSTADAASFSGENWLKADLSTVTAGAPLTKQVVGSFTRDSTGVAVKTIDITLATTTANSILFDTRTTASSTKTGILDKETTTANSTTPTAVNVTYSVSTLDLTATGVDNKVIDGMISAVDTALKAMTTGAADLGAAKKRIDLQKTFVNNLMDTIDRGIGSLVDADMNEESTKLQALQVQQQLGIQALSIANSSAQSILSLFR